MSKKRGRDVRWVGSMIVAAILLDSTVVQGQTAIPPSSDSIAAAPSDVTTVDYAQAAVSYRKAADQGGADAQFALAWQYEVGKGLPQDYAQAALWYRKAADQANVLAQLKLG